MLRGEKDMKTLFWNVDTQKDFMKTDGKLPVGEGQGAMELEENLRYLTDLATQENVQVVNTGDYHNQDSEEIVFPEENVEPDYLETFPPHCMQETEGVEFIDATDPEEALRFDWQQDYDVATELENYEGDVVIYKDRFNVFEGSPHTDDIVDEIDPDRVFVYGVATDVCVDQAIEGLLETGAEVYAVEDAVKGIDPEASDNCMAEWIQEGVKTVYTREVAEYL